MREQRAFREMTEALRRVRNSRNEKSGARRHDHQVTSGNSSVHSEAEYEMVEDEDTFMEAPWRQEQTVGLSLSKKFGTSTPPSLEKSEDGPGWNEK